MMETFGLDDVVIPIIGVTGSGKSSFIARCTGDYTGVGHGLRSFTKKVSYGTMIYKGRKIRLIDTPGFNDSQLDNNTILNEIALWLGLAYSQVPPLLLSGIIYLHPISEMRMKGSDHTNLAMFQALCGKESLYCVVLAATMCNKVDEATKKKRTLDLVKSYWNVLIQAGSTVIEYDDTKTSALTIIDRILERNTHIELKIQTQMITEGKTVKDTEAGRILTSKLTSECDKVEKLYQATVSELEDALSLSDETKTQELLDKQVHYKEILESKESHLNDLQMNVEQLLKSRKAELEQERKVRAAQQKEDEAKVEEMKQALEGVFRKQRELMESPLPSVGNEFFDLSQKNYSLEAEIKKQEQKLERDSRIDQERLEEQRHLEMIAIAKEGVKWAIFGGAIGAGSLGLAAAPMFCTVM